MIKLLLQIFFVLVISGNIRGAYCQTVNSTTEMKSIKFIPEEFHNVKLGYYESGENICTPFYPDYELKLRNQIAINVPQKIICQNADSCPVIPLCGAYIIGEKRGLKYDHLSTPIIHIRKIGEEKWHSGSILDANSAYEYPAFPRNHRQEEEKRRKKIKEAQKYTEEELNENAGQSFGQAINVNALDYINASFDQGVYEIFVSMFGLESNKVKVEIIIQNVNTTEMKDYKDKLHYDFKDYVPHKNFNIKEYNAKSGYSRVYRFIDGEGMEVEQTVNEESSSGKVKGYLETRKFPNSAFKLSAAYNSDGVLLNSIVTFHGMAPDFICYYDTNGVIIKKERFGFHYKFSIDDLINKMKVEHDVNITDIRLCFSVSRGVYDDKDNLPLYSVYLKGDPIKNILNCYVIDGNNGKTLFNTTRRLGIREKPPTDEYFNSLKNK